MHIDSIFKENRKNINDFRNEIVNISIKMGILSPFTAMLAKMKLTKEEIK